MKRTSTVLLALWMTAAAQAAPVYRCGSTYSQTPCPGGKLIDTADPRSQAQQAQARRVAAKERQQLAEMEKARAAREAASAASAAHKPVAKSSKHGTAHRIKGLPGAPLTPAKKPSSAQK